MDVRGLPPGDRLHDIVGSVRRDLEDLVRFLVEAVIA